MTLPVDLCLPWSALDDNLLECQQDFDHHVLKEDGQAGDNTTLLRMNPPVLSLRQLLNVCKSCDMHVTSSTADIT